MAWLLSIIIQNRGMREDMSEQQSLQGICHTNAQAFAGAMKNAFGVELQCDRVSVEWLDGFIQSRSEDLDPDTAEPVLAGTCPLHTGRFQLARSVEDSRKINDVRGTAVIIAASGMATGGRILHHLQRRLPDPKTTVLLVGFQAPGTRGRLIQDGARTIRIFGEDVPVHAHVDVIHGLSAHSDANGLLRWLRTASGRPRHVFVVHGELGAADTLAGRIRAELGWDASVPDYREVVTLD